jgi:hypothetical protein
MIFLVKKNGFVWIPGDKISHADHKKLFLSNSYGKPIFRGHDTLVEKKHFEGFWEKIGDARQIL